MAKVQNQSDLKQKLIRKARQLGVELVGFASVERWKEQKDIKPEYYPDRIFPFTKTVIVLGVPILIPMLDTTPSIVYSELYNTTNKALDETAYQLAVYLNKQNYRAVFFPRDGYGDISVLIEKPEAAFSHVMAGKYAGLGTIGYNHTLITKEFGPRVRLVSVFTDADITPDNMLEKDLCIQCALCSKCCPTSAFSSSGGFIADMDKHRCSEYHAHLKSNYRYPCGVCIKVCPVGKDRKLYGQSSEKYLKEREVLNLDPSAEDYSDWTHIRSFGSK